MSDQIKQIAERLQGLRDVLECGTFLPQVSLFENKYFLKD